MSMEENAEERSIMLHLSRPGTRILNAGCGTGQEAIFISLNFPKAQVLGIDLSRTSLAYGINKAKEYGVKNITFQQGDIMNLGQLDQKFDYIASAGVLHHMKDPVAGWRVLRDILKPDGVMTIGLYSKIARKDVIDIQKIAKNSGYPHTFSGMKAFRRDSLKMIPPNTLGNAAFFSDYYSLSMYRDLLFHVQEHDYDLMDVKEMLRELDLEFLSFILPQDQLNDYMRYNPDDVTLTNLDKWHQYELENTGAFKYMYQFWCRRKK